MDTKASNINTIDYILMSIHIDIKTLNITYYKVMNTKHGKLRTHEHKHKHTHNKLHIHEKKKQT